MQRNFPDPGCEGPDNSTFWVWHMTYRYRNGLMQPFVRYPLRFAGHTWPHIYGQLAARSHAVVEPVDQTIRQKAARHAETIP